MLAVDEFGVAVGRLAGGAQQGYAGTGKSAMLGVAREAWESSGYGVRGAALPSIAAENLESGSGISSRTIASLERQWGEGRELLTTRDVLAIDEAGMIGTRQLERVVAEVEKRGAKLVLVDDPEQLQAIEAGAAFRSIPPDGYRCPATFSQTVTRPRRFPRSVDLIGCFKMITMRHDQNRSSANRFARAGLRDGLLKKASSFLKIPERQLTAGFGQFTIVRHSPNDGPVLGSEAPEERPLVGLSGFTGKRS